MARARCRHHRSTTSIPVETRRSAPATPARVVRPKIASSRSEVPGIPGGSRRSEVNPSLDRKPRGGLDPSATLIGGGHRPRGIAFRSPQRGKPTRAEGSEELAREAPSIGPRAIVSPTHALSFPLELGPPFGACSTPWVGALVSCDPRRVPFSRDGHLRLNRRAFLDPVGHPVAGRFGSSTPVPTPRTGEGCRRGRHSFSQIAK